MTRIQSAAVYLIAIVLLIQFALDYGRPLVARQLFVDEYLQARIACHEILSAHRQDAVADGPGDTISLLIQKAKDVSLLSCVESKRLQLRLLSFGVSLEFLRTLDIEANIRGETDLRYLIQQQVSEQ
jgi:hypothetical protein